MPRVLPRNGAPSASPTFGVSDAGLMLAASVGGELRLMASSSMITPRPGALRITSERRPVPRLLPQQCTRRERTAGDGETTLAALGCRGSARCRPRCATPVPGTSSAATCAPSIARPTTDVDANRCERRHVVDLGRVGQGRRQAEASGSCGFVFDGFDRPGFGGFRCTPERW